MRMISISICFTPPSSTTTRTSAAAAALWYSKQPPLSIVHLPRPFYSNPRLTTTTTLQRRKIGHGSCRAELSEDAPLAVAIGACILNSLVFPSTSIQQQQQQDDDDDSVIDSTDSRLAVMGIISFIPYFNWLSWVFAWLDTGKRRYVVYSLVYLAPYLRSNLSLSPEESWLPIASILLCIVHIQLEVSVQNGDLRAFQLFTDIAKPLSSSARREREVKLQDGDKHFQEEGMEDSKNLPDGQEKSRNDIRGWNIPQKPIEDGDADRRKH